ncbi:MAG: hypothetical protein D6739_07925 [Nitrospirae bacterium]|nr:MAG: hypothetical protein D6739_07925 [Nitrospirota bacterium]
MRYHTTLDRRDRQPRAAMLFGLSSAGRGGASTATTPSSAATPGAAARARQARQAAARSMARGRATAARHGGTRPPTTGSTRPLHEARYDLSPGPVF